MTGRSTSSTAIVDPRRPLTTADTITITITIDESPRARTPSKDRFERLPLRTSQLYDRLRSFTEHGTRAVHLHFRKQTCRYCTDTTHEGKRFGEGNTNTHRKESISGKGMRAEDGSWLAMFKLHVSSPCIWGRLYRFRAASWHFCICWCICISSIA